VQADGVVGGIRSAVSEGVGIGALDWHGDGR
jgi:hypothetical protein